jgi:hypothetical protein
MNPAVLNRIPGAVIALLMVLLLSSWFAPGGGSVRIQQIDFWLVWIICMVVLALPLTLLEAALARRSQTSPLQALSTLTREADVKPTWRLVGWLAVGVMALIAGGMAHQSAGYVLDRLSDSGIQAPELLLWLIVPLLAIGLSFVPRLAVGLGVVFAVLAVEISTFHQGIGQWAWTGFSLIEWSSAVVLALVASGLGMGLYWQAALEQQRDQASQAAVPIWAAQVVAGVLFAFAQGIHSHWATTLYAVALVCGSAYLICMVRVQLAARGFPALLQWATIATALMIWLAPWSSAWVMLASIWGLVVCAVYALFSGWQMKISHLRKALSFDQEGIYNLWRIAMRLAIPLAILVAMLGIIQQAYLLVAL